MSKEQADALNNTLRNMGVLPPSTNGTHAHDDTPEDDAPPALPPLELPRDGWGLDDFAREAGIALRNAGIFRRDSMPVHINEETGNIEPLDADTFRTLVAESVFLFKWKAEKGKEQPVRVKTTMSADTSRGTLRSRIFIRQLRKIARVNFVRQPIARRDGRIELLPEGYDEESEVYTLPSEVVVREDMPIEEADNLLLDLYREFPFADWCHLEVDQRTESREFSKQIAGMVSFYGSLLLPHTIKRQGLLFNANTQRSGKTLLAQMIVIPVQGRCKVTTKPESAEEMRKTLDTVALSGSPYLVLDDLIGRLTNQALNAFMTSPWWSGRAMHSQKEFEVGVHCNVFLTGHNLDTSGDIAGRVLEVRLHVEQADVQAHQIKRVISEHWLTQTQVRSDICSALYALVRNWVEKGKPESENVKAGYAKWCGVFGGIVAAAGLGDPCERRATDESTDPEFEDMRTLVWHFMEKCTEPVLELRYEEMIQACQDLALLEWLIEGKTTRNGDARIFEPSARCNARLGILWSRKYGGRIFHLQDGRAVRFGSRGRQRHKKYELTLVDPV